MPPAPAITDDLILNAEVQARFPALAQLRLSSSDLELLRHQGAAFPDRRRNRVYYKLVFRRNGIQKARYIGDETAAALVKAELELLQQGRHNRLRLARLERIARNLLRDSKRQLEPLLDGHGFRFHGREIRRTRKLTLVSDPKIRRNQ